MRFEIRGRGQDGTYSVQIVKVSTDVSAVSFEGMARKTAQGEHLPESDQIIVHNDGHKIGNLDGELQHF